MSSNLKTIFLNVPVFGEDYNGQWTYNSGTKTITFYDDANYKVKSISSKQLEIESFDEGYVDYFDKDFNNDGVVDKVITILIKS